MVLTDRVVERQYIERKVLADSVRTAHHGDRHQYDRYIRSLEPRSVREDDDAPSADQVIIPKGMDVQEDF